MKENVELQTFNTLFTNYKGRFVHFARTYVDDGMAQKKIQIKPTPDALQKAINKAALMDGDICIELEEGEYRTDKTIG